MQAITAEQPAVLFLYEVLGDLVAFRRLRAELRRCGYEARILVGTDDGYANGIVVAVDRRTARLVASTTLAPRTMAISVQHMGEALQRHYVGVHGLHKAAVRGGETYTLRRQLRVAGEWLETQGGGTVGGDINAVPCKSWRAQETPLTRSDRALRAAAGWQCSCCGRTTPPGGALLDIVDGTGASSAGASLATIRWTRYHASGGVWTAPTSRIDILLQTRDGHRWVEGTSYEPTADATQPGDAGSMLSDHLRLLDCTILSMVSPYIVWYLSSSSQWTLL